MYVLWCISFAWVELTYNNTKDGTEKSNLVQKTYIIDIINYLLNVGH